MITFDFEYVKPQSIQDVITILRQIENNNKTAMYYAGGTEFISRARAGEITTDVVIDLKHIPECHVMTQGKGYLTIGSMVNLTDIVDQKVFPLLTTTAQQIAHRTARNIITIGGSITSHLIYREALLPFLLANSTLVIATKHGDVQNIPMNDIYQHGLKLKDGAFIVQIITEEKYLLSTYYHRKLTKQSNVNYPIVTLAAMKIKEKLRVALSGVCSYPLRLETIESILNDSELDYNVRISEAIKQLPEPIINDMYASSEFRTVLLERTLLDMFQKMEGA